LTVEGNQVQSLPENISIENQYLKVGLKKGPNYFVNSFFDKTSNQNLLSAIYIWYQGKSYKEDKFYATWHEQNWDLVEIQNEKNKILVKSENIDFLLLKEIVVDDILPVWKIKYTLTAKNNFSPRLNVFPLIDLSSIFKKVYLLEDDFKKYDFKEIKKINVSKENICVFENESSNVSLAVILNNSVSTFSNYLSHFSIEDVGWCKRINVIHDYDGWEKYLKKGEKVETEIYFFLLNNPDKNIWKNEIESLITKLNLKSNEQKIFIEKQKEKIQPSLLAYKLDDTSDFYIWYENSIKRVYPETLIPTSFGDNVEVEMAKGEGESFQIVISPQKEIKLLNIKIPDFKNKDFILNKNSFECFHLSSAILNGEGSFDCLTPIDKSLPVILERGTNNVLWFSIYTPGNIPAGDYDGEISFEFDNNGEKINKEINVKIHIWDFKLPSKLPFRAFGLLWRFYLLPEYFSGNISSENLDMAYINCLSKYHITTDLIANSRENRLKIFDGKKTDLSSFEQRAKEAVENLNYNVLSVPNVYLANWSWKKGQKVAFMNLDPESEEFERLYSTYLKEVSKLLEKNNWFDISILYIWDEIYGDDAYNLLDEKLSKMIWGVDKRFKIFIVGPPDEKILRNCNIVCPGSFTGWWNEKAEKVVEKIKKDNKEIWVYLNAEAFAPNQPAIITRLVPWTCWTRGITGYLFWSLDYWAGNDAAKLFHPGADFPQPSVRLEYFRDGIEDFTYFEILKHLLNEKNENIEKEVLQIVPKIGDANYNSLEEVVNLRKKVGETIENLMKKK